MSKLWFKAKQYGWGWTPASWQGWVSIVFYIFLLIRIFSNAYRTTDSASEILTTAIVPFLLLTFLLIALCYAKGEKPQWRWGKKTEQAEQNMN